MTEADKVRADIELTRAELAATVDALRTKLDVKAQAKTGLRQARLRAGELVQENRQVLLAAGGTVLILVLLRARRRKGG